MSFKYFQQWNKHASECMRRGSDDSPFEVCSNFCCLNIKCLITIISYNLLHTIDFLLICYSNNLMRFFFMFLGKSINMTISKMFLSRARFTILCHQVCVIIHIFWFEIFIWLSIEKGITAPIANEMLFQPHKIWFQTSCRPTHFLLLCIRHIFTTLKIPFYVLCNSCSLERAQWLQSYVEFYLKFSSFSSQTENFSLNI